MPTGRGAHVDVAGYCLVAVIATVPTLMSAVMARGLEISRLLVAFPLVTLALLQVRPSRTWAGLFDRSAVDRVPRLTACALAACIAISIVLAADPMAALLGEFTWREGGVAWLAYGAFFVAMRACFGAREHVALVQLLLLSLVAPLATGFLQLAGLDAFPTTIDTIRFSGTIGNANTAAAVLAMLLPACLVMASRRGEGGLAPRVFWGSLCVAMVVALALSLSRGGWIAAAAGLFTLACVVSFASRRRWVIWGTCGLIVTAGLVVGLVNLWPAASDFASGNDLVSRLLYRSQPHSRDAVNAASLSVMQRLGLWEIGLRTLASSSPGVWLFGYGPDSAGDEYYRHVPIEMVRQSGYLVIVPLARLDSEIYDVVLNLGGVSWLLITLLFAAAVRHGVRNIFGVTAGGVMRLAGLSIAGGLLSGGLAWALAGPAAVLPGMALGIGAGWALHIASASLAGELQAAVDTRALLLHGALLAGVLAYWIAAQFNPMSMVTRLVLLTLMALMLCPVENGPEADGTPARPDSARLPAFGLACAILACMWTALPPLTDYSAASGNAVYSIGRALFPMLAVLVAGMWWYWSSVSVKKLGLPGACKPWRVWALLAAVALVLIWLRSWVSTDDGGYAVLWVTASAGLLPVALVGASAIAGWNTIPAPGHAGKPGVAPPGWRASLAYSAGLAAVAGMLVIAHADVSCALAEWRARRFPQDAPKMMARAVRWMPHERYYWRRMSWMQMNAVEQRVRTDGISATNLESLVSNLADAEAAGRMAVERFSRDPWTLLSFADVRQAQSMRVFRSVNESAGALAATDANVYYAAAHLLFPNHPLILRNWAEHRVGEGRVEEGYALFERMQALVPNDVEPYRAYVTAARRIGDAETARAVLAHAQGVLDKNRFAELVAVSKLQQMSR